MRSPSGRWVLTYNGELYNTPSCGPDSERPACSSRGTSDTEVAGRRPRPLGSGRDPGRASRACSPSRAWDARVTARCTWRVTGSGRSRCSTAGPGLASPSPPSSRRSTPSRGFDPDIDRAAVTANSCASAACRRRSASTAGWPSSQPGTRVAVDATARPGVLPEQSPYWSAPGGHRRRRSPCRRCSDDREATDRVEAALSRRRRRPAWWPTCPSAPSCRAASTRASSWHSCSATRRGRSAPSPSRSPTSHSTNRPRPRPSRRISGTEHTTVEMPPTRGVRHRPPGGRDLGRAVLGQLAAADPSRRRRWPDVRSPSRCPATAGTSCSPGTTVTPGSTECGGGRPGPELGPPHPGRLAPPVPPGSDRLGCRAAAVALAGAPALHQGGQGRASAPGSERAAMPTASLTAHWEDPASVVLGVTSELDGRGSPTSAAMT